MTSQLQSLEALKTWYGHARRYYAEHDGDRVAQLDALVERLSVPPPAELPICFLGSAGVGKSTLLNALVAGEKTVVPQGGVGPLTAQATLVRYAPERSFRATYLSRKHLNNLTFALERAFDHDERRRGGRADDLAAPPPPDLSAEDLLEVELAQPDEAETEVPEDQRLNPRERIDAYVKQASLMILGTQFPPEEPRLPYLVDALRACLGQESRFREKIEEEHQVRIQRIRQVLAIATEGRPYEVTAAAVGDNVLAQELSLHASGYLAPLIRQLEVSWDSQALQHGITLVDLPGVGVANDEYRRVTAEWIRKARAVVLVVDRAGVTEAAAELLRTTGFMNSLLHESHDPDAEPATLIVAVVKLDVVASDQWRTEEDRVGDDARPWVAHFDEVCQQIITVIRGQIQQELDRLVEQGPDATQTERQAMTRRVLEDLEIRPLCAHEYRLLLRKKRMDPARIDHPEESRIPQFVDALNKIGAARQARNAKRATERFADATGRFQNGLTLILERWREGDRAAEEAQKLREELAVVAAPLQRELHVRQGAFRALLRHSIPREIQLRTENASQQARVDISKFLRKRYGNYHWATLRAAVRKNGTFVGARKVNLPDELTLRFEEPLAVIWSKEILLVLRQETRRIAEDYVRLVGALVEWARGQGARVKPQLLEALHADLKAQTNEVASTGREAIDELKESVKTQLFGAVEEAVRLECQKFVKASKDRGAGVKARLFDLLADDLAESVVNAARPAAQRILDAHFRTVEREVSEALNRIPDPIESAVAAIVDAHQSHLRRSDAQKRRQVIEEGEGLAASLVALAAGIA